MDSDNIKVNEFQTPLADLNIDKEPLEIQEAFWDFFYNVPYIQSLVSPDRKRAKDLPKDEQGRIIVDITQPHILEDMDYFRQTALHYKKTGKYTDLRPNGNPNSEYGRWYLEEVRRCWEGMVRPSDGEWIPGDLYFFWNYCPMQLIEKDSKTSKKGNRVLDFPQVWEGHYYKAHYLEQARNNGNHALELAARSKGKSFWGAAMLAKRFILGESDTVKKKVTCYATAAEKKFLVAGDQTLDKFQFDIDFIADNTDFPHNRLVNTLLNMQWTMGYVDNDTGIKKGTLNSVVGVTAKDDESKLRGTRAVLYIIEESGTFPRLLQLWNNLRPSVEYGDDTFGMLYGYGTSGDSDSDFRAMAEMMYNPSGYKVYSVSNVYDLECRGGNVFTYFFPGYLNLANYYDENGNSDVTGALMYILKDRHHVKYNTTDINAIIKRTAEIPIVPQEAILQSRGNMFPVAEINERIAELDGNPHSFDDVYVGKMIQKSNGDVDFEITNDTPIRMYPLKDNKVKGALEIYKMPEKGTNGKVFSNRYIVGHDPVDNDVSDTMSLSSTFVFDLFTDSIVAEYTGRSDLAVESYETVRRLCIFYNAQCLYENNIHGLYGYMMQMRCGYLLADTPEYLKEKDLVKNIGVGNGAKGVRATLPVNNHANDLIREWLLSSKTQFIDEKEITVHNVALIKSRALLQELSQYNPKINVDRIRAFGMVMILREHYRILYQGDVKGNQKPEKTLLDDPFFKRNSPFRHDDNDEKGTFKPL